MLMLLRVPLQDLSFVCSGSSVCDILFRRSSHSPFPFVCFPLLPRSRQPSIRRYVAIGVPGSHWRSLLGVVILGSCSCRGSSLQGVVDPYPLRKGFLSHPRCRRTQLQQQRQKGGRIYLGKGEWLCRLCTRCNIDVDLARKAGGFRQDSKEGVNRKVVE
jgi:hypothetical protein